MKILSPLHAAVAALLCVATAVPQNALAQTPAYVGTWAAQTHQCRLGQDTQDAPMIIRRNRYDQHETHCTFRSVHRQGSIWKIKAQCQVEGDRQDVDFSLQVAGNRLTFRDRYGARALRRCH